jgi:hypothetical protein
MTPNSREAARRAIHEAMRAGRTQLDLSGLALTSLPADVRRFTRLRKLNAEHNRLRALPAWIGELTSLHTLELAHNQLRTLPAELVHLTRLPYAPTALNTGVTQWLDDYQRGSFWSTVSTTSPGYHLLLDPSDVPAVPLHVPAAQGITFFNLNTNRTVGAVTGDWFRHQLLGLLSSLQVSPTTLAVFVPYNTYVTDQNPNDCLRPPGCAPAAGFHSAAVSNTNPHAINTFAYAAYQDAGTLSPYNWSTYGLSHEILEWAADPFVHSSRIQGQGAFLANTAPAWSSPYWFGGSVCSPVLEVADPLFGWYLNVPPDQHFLSDGAFLSWFARQSPSTGFGGLYDMAGIFSTYSTAC